MADGTLRWTVVPGRLLEHLTHFGVAPRGALFVGALNIDEEAARLAGIAFLRAQDFSAHEETSEREALQHLI